MLNNQNIQTDSITYNNHFQENQAKIVPNIIINQFANKLENRINSMSSNFYNNDNGKFIGKMAGIDVIILLHSLELTESQLKIVQKAIINF